MSSAREQALSALGEAEASRLKLSEVHGRLRETSAELGRLFVAQTALVGAVVKAKASPAELRKAIENLQETQMSFNMQYLALQEKMQNENRTYTTVSNVLKTRHDTVKNSISNIR